MNELHECFHEAMTRLSSQSIAPSISHSSSFSTNHSTSNHDDDDDVVLDGENIRENAAAQVKLLYMSWAMAHGGT